MDWEIDTRRFLGSYHERICGLNWVGRGVKVDQDIELHAKSWHEGSSPTTKQMTVSKESKDLGNG